MRKNHMRYFMFFLTFLLLSCQANKQIVLNSYDGAKMYFGNGGGFAGVETRYCLLDNGKLHKVGMNENDLTFVSKIPKNQTKQIFANYKILKLDEFDINKPQNRYNFIQYQDVDSEHNLTWSGQSEATKNLNLYYSILKNLIATK